VAARLAEYEGWRADRAAAVAQAGAPSLRIRTATSIAVDRTFDSASAVPPIEVIDFSRHGERPFGPRFGTLVHATLATVALDAGEAQIAAVARVQGRILPAPGTQRYADEEVYAAVEVVSSLLRDPLFDRVRQAEHAGRCDRELPIVWKAPDGTLIEGTIDLAFADASGLTVIDFKTDRELSTDLDRYKRQLSVYCQALGALRHTAARGILAKI
jgi:ATP-dependent exoDNAse (exonuclease V) beta subunit